MLRFLTALLICLCGLSYGQLQVRVDGPGYFRFFSKGKVFYAKSANLVVVDGKIGLASGETLAPGLQADQTSNLTIELDGEVSVAGQTVGRIVLASFESELDVSSGLASSAARPRLGSPGEGAFGVIRCVSTSQKPVQAHAPKPVAKKTNLAAPPIKERARTTIRLHDLSAIDKETITLGDVSEISAEPAVMKTLQSLELGQTPPLNVDRIVDRTRIMVRLKSVGIDLAHVDLLGPERAKVTRKGQKVGYDQFVQAGREGAKAKGYMDLEPTNPGPDMNAPIGKLELVTESVNVSSEGLSVLIGTYVDGKRFNSRTIKFRSTAVNLRLGTVVTVTVKRNSLTVQSKGKVVKFDQATGQATVQIIDTGALLTGKAMTDGSVEVQA